MDLAVRQLIDMNEPDQIIKLNLWIRLRWIDCLLTWNPSDYDNITDLIVPFDKVWTPDITIYDSVSEELYGLEKFRANVSYDGAINYNFPTVIEIQCQVDVTNFPFDRQMCPLQFGSWIYTGNLLDMNIENDHADLSALKENVEWEISKVPAEKHITKYSLNPDPFVDLTYNLYLKRKPRYYEANIILPSIIITLLATLGFLLPVDSGEKVSLEVTVMLSLTVFQLLVADRLPPSDEARPLLGEFFTFTLILCGLSTFVQVTVINIYYRGDRKMSVWMNKLILKPLAKITLTKATLLNQKAHDDDNTTNDDSIDDLDNTTKWQTLSICIDRVGLILFIVILTIGCIVIFTHFT
ncbi:neuronal acetylcholine receptor subunit alpha-10-like isoform X3 [Mytilus californianus]|uniref:neuronal acetylcholine receptor subunit alpha-10-like isoform X1 n=1 Tax=Mytilus californianus TaxID=6549 RepID=UPI0022458669|nr:neuronal acetylcholine receptor subunit alpha-10-like isoform X1 [Mytilus californianus]XP_052102780.1 neuronal acetylcholine receptor subunit alpha-10-like isoform X2 [Mytilus californianus]XP_052102781.1 neuronal acetylcholine receptor subunit alpha-10-like isoform X3 [Mytilus californianus]